MINVAVDTEADESFVKLNNIIWFYIYSGKTISVLIQQYSLFYRLKFFIHHLHFN